MRVTQTMIQRTLLLDLQRARVRLAETSEQASSGLRVNRPSDDPGAAARASSLRASLQETAQLGRNLDQAETRLFASDRAIEEGVDILIRARELAIQGANDTQDALSRQLIAEEVASLHQQLVAAGNTRLGGAYLFAGYDSATAAFSSSGPFGSAPPAPTVTYDGSSDEVELEIEDGVLLPTTFDGRRVFMGDADGNGAPDAGREDLFDTLADLWEALQNNDRDAVAAAAERLDTGQQQLQVERARGGSLLSRLESARNGLGRTELGLTELLSQTEDADSVRVFSDLVQQETLLNASLQMTARVVQPSLLDFLG